MNIITNLKNLFRREAGETPAQASRGPRYGYDLISPTGNALNVSTVYCCVNQLADAVANLPLQYMRLKDGIFITDVNSRLHYLLTVQPCPYMSAFEFWRLVVVYLQLRGNAYIVPVYSAVTMDIDYLMLPDPGYVTHDTINDTYTVTDANAGIQGTYREDEVIHLMNFTTDGKTGLSTLQFARVTTEIAEAGDVETLNRFKNGGNVRGVVSNDNSVRGFGEYQDKQLAATATDLDGRFRSGERIVSLPGQVHFSPISLSSTDMQFLESRKFSVRDLCRFFRVPPSFVFDDTSNNYKSAEMANVAFLSQTLNPLLRRIETELLRKLVPAQLSSKRRFQFDRRGLYSCDLDSRVNYQAKTIAAGIYTVNEWRREENKPNVDGGDKVLVSANLKDINDTAAVPANSNDKKQSDGEK